MTFPSTRLNAGIRALLFCVAVTSAPAQQPLARIANGSATLSSTFDPANPVIPSRAPASIVVVTGDVSRRTVLPPEQYNILKSGMGTTAGKPGVDSRAPSGGVVPAPRFPVATTPTLSFAGIPETLLTPPSPSIAVGPDDIIQVVNASIARFDRTGKRTNIFALSTWFADILPSICVNCLIGDVTVTYDQMHGHFIVMARAEESVSSDVSAYLILSVSKGATYASGWKNWGVQANLDGTTVTNNVSDFPQPGLDNVAFYATSLQFGHTDGKYKYSKIRIFKKTDLYNLTATSLPFQDIFDLKNEDGTAAATLQVANLRGRTEVGTGAAYVMNSSEVTSPADYYTLWTIQNPGGANPTIARTTLRNIWPYTYASNAPQKGSNFLLDTGPASMSRLVQRDGLLYAAHNSGYSDEPTTVTYAVVDAVNKKVNLLQRYTGGNYFYPALDIPASLGPGTALPNNLVVGTTTDSNGALTYPSVRNLVAGDTPYTNWVSGRDTNVVRWGEYFTSAVDPVNGGLWFTGEYATSQPDNRSHWATWNAFFPALTDRQFDDVPNTRPGYDAINIMKLWRVTIGCSATPALYCPDNPVSRAELAAFVVRAMYGENFTAATTPYFTDVPATHPQFTYIQKFKELGFTDGCGPATFCPSMPATRANVAVFLARGKMKKLFGDNFTYPATPYFDDVPATNSAFKFVQKIRELGITQGCSTTPALFCPDQNVTREQVSTLIVRAFLN